MSLIDLITGLDGSGLVITDEDLIKKELTDLGIDPEAEAPEKLVCGHCGKPIEGDEDPVSSCSGDSHESCRDQCEMCN